MTAGRARRRTARRHRTAVDLLLGNLTGAILAAGLLCAYLGLRGHIAF